MKGHEGQGQHCEKTETVDQYIERQDEAVRPYLDEVRKVIHDAIPEAQERISWSMPTFWKGRNLIHFAASKRHLGLYPGGEATTVFAEKLAGYDVSKGTIRIPYTKPIPKELISEIAVWCYKQYAKYGVEDLTTLVKKHDNDSDIGKWEDSAMAKTLIAFFSRADENYFGGAMRYIKVGNTEVVCNIIKDLISADTFKIEMKNPYSPDYMTCIDEAKKDLRENARPELVRYLDSIEGYDTIILAYPNYWGTIPMAVATFLERYDFFGKTILPLCTNEGSGMGGSERGIKKSAPGAELRSGLSIIGSEASNSKTAVQRWLSSNGLM